MQKPVWIQLGTRGRWSHNRAQLIEYILWESKGLLGLSDIGEKLLAYNVHYSQSNICNVLAGMLRDKRAVRPVRGLYAHIDHADEIERLFS